MRGYLTNPGPWIAVAMLALAPVFASRAADLTGARVWAGPQYTRVVLDASDEFTYQVSQDGDKVVVTINDSRAADDFTDPAAQGLLRGMTHQRQGDRLQLTAKVNPDSHIKSFVLKPGAGNDYRLVLDLYPGADVTTTDTPPSKDIVAVAKPVERKHRKSSHSGRVATEQAATLLGGERKVVVCIDAGHGGKDSGARGPDGTLEKNVTLDVARDLAAQINRQPGMQAVLTRDGDFYIPLKQRYQIARDNNADLFVSIHADSYSSDDARGSSVWVLSSRGKTSEAARWLADGENRADLIGGTTLDDKDDGLAKVLLDLQQGWAMQASDVVAGNVLGALAKLGPTHRGYVERANFVVLRSPDVPSILVETAFISNPVEERKLRDPAHQDRLAASVMAGVKSYFESTPPPGTWFAAEAARRNGVELASNRDSVNAAKPDGDELADSSHMGSKAGESHRVGRGESLGSIARQYGVSVSALKNANRMNTNTVRAGTVLTIPTG